MTASFTLSQIDRLEDCLNVLIRQIGMICQDDYAEQRELSTVREKTRMVTSTIRGLSQLWKLRREVKAEADNASKEVSDRTSAVKPGNVPHSGRVRDEKTMSHDQTMNDDQTGATSPIAAGPTPALKTRGKDPTR